MHRGFALRLGLLAALLSGATAQAQQEYPVSIGAWGRGEGIETGGFGRSSHHECTFLLGAPSDTRGRLDAARPPTLPPGLVWVEAKPYGCPSGTGAYVATGELPWASPARFDGTIEQIAAGGLEVGPRALGAPQRPALLPEPERGVPALAGALALLAVAAWRMRHRRP